MKFSLLLSFFLLSSSIHAQVKDASKNHILLFKAELADTLINVLDPRSSDKTSYTSKVKQNRLYVKNQIDTLAWMSLNTELKKSGFPISSNEELKQYIKFGMDGTPMALSLKSGIKNLGKKGYHGGQYFAAEIKIAPSTLSLMGKGIRPTVEVNLRRFDHTGKVINRIIKKHKSPEPILAYVHKDNPFLKSSGGLEMKKGLTAKAGEVVFDKSRRPFMELFLHELTPVIEAAIKNAVAEVK